MIPTEPSQLPELSDRTLDHLREVRARTDDVEVVDAIGAILDAQDGGGSA